MAKIQKIRGAGDHTLPLRMTQRKVTGKKGASFRIGCGCCTQGLVIFPPPSPPDDSIEINGVMGSRDQWQQVFGPLLNMVPKTTP